jgi:hypothetical protein
MDGLRSWRLTRPNSTHVHNVHTRAGYDDRPLRAEVADLQRMVETLRTIVAQQQQDLAEGRRIAEALDARITGTGLIVK